MPPSPRSASRSVAARKIALSASLLRGLPRLCSRACPPVWGPLPAASSAGVGTSTAASSAGPRSGGPLPAAAASFSAGSGIPALLINVEPTRAIMKRAGSYCKVVLWIRDSGHAPLASRFSVGPDSYGARSLAGRPAGHATACRGDACGRVGPPAFPQQASAGPDVPHRPGRRVQFLGYGVSQFDFPPAPPPPP